MNTMEKEYKKYLNIPFKNGWDYNGCHCGALVTLFYEDMGWYIEGAHKVLSNEKINMKTLLKGINLIGIFRKEYDFNKLKYGDVVIFGSEDSGGCGILLDKNYILTTAYRNEYSCIVKIIDLIDQFKFGLYRIEK